MIAVLAAALWLASSLTIALDVPYLPQTDALCGGAAAAMVFRYRGDAHAGVESFAPLVDRRAGGIENDVLVGEIERRGWIVDRVDGSMAAIEARLEAGDPVVVLLAQRGRRYHYVVVVGRTGRGVLVHDPSWGPNREIAEREFLQRWSASAFWAIDVRPRAVRPNADTPHDGDQAGGDPTGGNPTGVVSGFSRTVTSACSSIIDRAVAEVRARGLDSADGIFADVRRRCPGSSAPLRELAGIRFAQRRWSDAASLARQALDIDAPDDYALDVLGSSLFMLNDPGGALRAWNQLGRPTLDRVLVSGLNHTRYQAIADALHLTPGALLTADAFERARRRLEDLPDRATARLDVRPESDGFASVDLVIAERSAIPRGPAEWSTLGLEAAIDREVTSTLPGFTGEGETWSASWRWWANRPRVALAFAAPRFAGMPGVWRLDAAWEAESYAFGDSSALLRESRTHLALSVSDWMSSRWRYSVRAGFDEWSGGRRGVSAGGAIEERLIADRVSLRADGDTWIAAGALPGFSTAALRARWTSRPIVRGWSAAATAGAQHATSGAPLALWAGAGDGHERGELLRAHPMLDDGVIDVTSGAAFGRTLVFGNAEAQRWMDTPWPARVGVAVFADAARATDRFGPGGVLQVDAGAGLRLRIPGVARTLRVDVAHGMRDGANAITMGWMY